ncbi:cytochrome P450 [Whalleya microplaca]|nr:cytochrome P450 [Whalleya microplaca]
MSTSLISSTRAGEYISGGLPYLPFIVVAAVVASYVKAWFKLRKFKGPLLASFSESWIFKTAYTGEMHLRLADTVKKYGPSNSAHLVRIGPNELISDDPDVGRHMSAARLKHSKTGWYASLKVDPYVDNIFSELDPIKHDKLRGQISSAFQMKENPQLGAQIDLAISSFIDLIERKYISSSDCVRPMDFALVAQYFSLDVVSSFVFGQPFGDLATDQDIHGYVSTINAVLPFVTMCSSTPTLGRIMNQRWLMNLVGPSPKDEKGQGKLMAIAQEYVGQRFGPNKVEARDMLGSFLSHGMSRRQAESEILTQILAGSDTTSTAVRSIFLFIISNPQVHSRLLAEIDDGIEKGRVSSPITDEEAKDIPYLQACIQEGLRIWPPFTGMLMKKTNPGGEVIKGTFVPGGTSVGHCGWGMQRGPEFGEDVEVFRPERWLEADPDRKRHMERTVDIIFGSGRWACLGKAIVRAELNKIFVELLRRFNFFLLHPNKPWDSRNYTLFLQNKMWVRVTRREKA